LKNAHKFIKYEDENNVEIKNLINAYTSSISDIQDEYEFYSNILLNTLLIINLIQSKLTFFIVRKFFIVIILVLDYNLYMQWQKSIGIILQEGKFKKFFMNSLKFSILIKKLVNSLITIKKLPD